MKPVQEILVATDFGECSRRALESAIDLAKKLGAHLTVMHAYEIPAYAYTGTAFSTTDLLTPIEEAAQKNLDEVLVAVRATLPTATGVLRMGVPWEQVLESADRARADLVVLGTHGRRGVAHVILGSVAEKVVRLSPVPVLTVRGDGVALRVAEPASSPAERPA